MYVLTYKSRGIVTKLNSLRLPPPQTVAWAQNLYHLPNRLPLLSPSILFALCHQDGKVSCCSIWWTPLLSRMGNSKWNSLCKKAFKFWLGVKSQNLKSFSYLLLSPSPLCSFSSPSLAIISVTDSHSLLVISSMFINFLASEYVNKCCMWGQLNVDTFFRREKDNLEVEYTKFVKWGKLKTSNSWSFSNNNAGLCFQSSLNSFGLEIT